ncbi:YceI family protein [Brevibacterium atlanticum]|uniref:YceI family protein n=1 Tax=Brevibacterium atlanticum TaxID=2697563 RepID=UPI001422BEE5|nr:YceI family protein [Brevibacterium atlanticum]
MSAAPGLTGHWDIDPAHSRLGFSTRHAMISRVRGAFNDVTGSAEIADDLSASTATVVIKTASVDTRSEDRDNHLRSADFFDVETYPEIRFVSSAIDEVDENSFIVTGELTIRDMTKTVSVPLELIGIETDPFGSLRAGLEGTRRIDRKDWGVTWNTKLDSGGVLVSDKITLEFELSLIKEADEAAPADSADDAAESSEETTPAEAPTDEPTPEPADESKNAESADAEKPAPEAAPDPKADPQSPEAPPAPETDGPKPAPETRTAPKADDILPPPPPVAPAEKQVGQPVDKRVEPQPKEQSSGKPLGKLFGLR